MAKLRNRAFLCSIIIGLVLIVVGLIIQVPGGAVTTRESLDGHSTDYYVFDNKYSSIDEYVGGDAYNYIIGASLVAGKISGTMTTKAIFIVGGIMCVCFGLTLLMVTFKGNDTNMKDVSANYDEFSADQSENSEVVIDSDSEPVSQVTELDE